MGRNTATRDLHRRIIRRGHPDCGICHKPIDYGLPYLHPGSYVVDHVVPYALGGPDTLENKQASHRACNRLKSDKVEPPAVVAPVATDRRW